MRIGGWSISLLAALALAGCKSEAPPAKPLPSETTSTPAEQPVSGPERRIVAFGDSLFAGYGLEEGQSYPDRLEAALRARGVNAKVANAGVSGDTTAAGRQRLSFVLDAQERTPDLFILELGGNDLLRGLPPAQTRDNLAAMLAELKKRQIPVLLMGMRAPPNGGPEFQQSFDAIYPELAKEYGASLVPFLLEGVWNRPDLVQADRIHPTAQGIETMVAATVDEVAEALPPSE